MKYCTFKRILDIFFSLLILPFVLLIIVVISPLILIDDGSPVFFKQNRRGIHGSVFKILKFRTMRVNAPELRSKDGSVLSFDGDNRITRVGQFLRKTSIDEIPQLINILKGDMSFIGPRPTLATLDYSQYSDEKKKRLLVRPGLTGYSQAYYRNSIDADEKFRLDCYYVDNISLKMDLSILLKTVKTVLMRRGVYGEKPTSTK